MSEHVYCSLDDVRGRTRQRLRDNDNPSAATVEEWILDGTAHIDSALSDLTPPFSDSEKAMRIIRPLAIDYAASRVYGALENLPRAEALDHRFESMILALQENRLRLHAPHLPKSKFAYGGLSHPPPWRDGEERIVHVGGEARR